jgi:hypothetical protein
VERGDTRHLVASACEHADMTGYRRNLRAQAKQSSFLAEVKQAGLLRRVAPRNDG